MKFYNSEGVELKIRKKIPAGAHYYTQSGELRFVPSVASDEKDVFKFVYECMSTSRPGISVESVQEIWDYYEEKRDLIISYLKALENFYAAEGDKWRVKAYAGAHRAIKESRIPIASGEQAMMLRGVGKSIGLKIDEILETGKLDYVDINIQSVLDRIKVIDLFMTVWGIGPKKARKLYDEGYRTLDDLRDMGSFDVLTTQERIGLKYYDDFMERIPRSEIEGIEDELRKTWDGNFVIAGSYRRGSETSGDIDILISSNDNSRSDEQFSEYISELEKKDILREKLAQGNTKYMGVINTGTHNRRIDIRMIPEDRWATALLYFTGSAGFNVRMRAKALEKGLTLNEYELKRVKTGDIIPVESEEDIFKAIGMDYVAPNKRS